MADIKGNFGIRSMSVNDIHSAMKLSSDEGWNQTEKDWKLLLEDPANICLALESEKRIIGSSTALNYSNKLAWIGMVLIDKDFRGQGLGKLIFQNLLNRLTNYESIKLDATNAGHSLYLKSGFIDEFIIIRMTISSCKISEHNDNSNEVELITSKTLPQIIEFDKNIFGIDRTSLLKTFLKNYPQKAFVLKRNNEISGYMMGRDGIRYNYIGPVYADSTDDAKVLISEAFKSLKNKPVALDVLDDKIDLIYWLSSMGFSIQRSFTRMYFRNNNFRGKCKNQYLIFGPEFG